MTINAKKKSRGFALMKESDPVRFRTVSSRAGHNSQKAGPPTRWSKKEAQAMASKGGKARWKGKKL